jgi:lysophospholipase L1-like esterase
MAASSPTRFCVNKGRSGGSALDINGDFSTNIAPFLNRGIQTGALVFLGTNDIVIEGQSGTTAWANQITLLQSLRSAGVYPIVVVTMLPRGSSYESQRQALIALQQANWSTYADGLADVTTLASGMGAAGANSNTTWYNADGIHPNDLGHGNGNLEGLISSVVTPLW